MRAGYVYEYCRAIKEALACNKMEIDWKERGLGLSVPGPPARWPADEVA